MGEIILDRRQSIRFPFEAKAILCFAGAVYSAVTRDLSSKGAFLVTDLAAPVSTEVELTLDVHDGLSPIEISGRVVRVTFGSESPRGLGIEFDEVEAKVAQRIVAATRQS
ncbi:MAG: PilZ domain-containing protein [Myxococcales bacterium]|nr:PilZ domain-containing protein [Myxococcales bacterium]